MAKEFFLQRRIYQPVVKGDKELISNQTAMHHNFIHKHAPARLRYFDISQVPEYLRGNEYIISKYF